MTLHNGSYAVQPGQLEIEEAVNLVPGQQELNSQIQTSEENRLAAIQANSKEELRLLDNLIDSSKGFSSKLGQYLKQKKEKLRKDREAELLLRVAMFGVGENLSNRFEDDSVELFDDHIAINKEANKIEKSTDAVTSQEFRNLAQWEQTIIARGWALNLAKQYPTFLAQNKETESITVDGKKVYYDEGDIHQKKAIEAAVKLKFMGQFGGLSEALVAKVVKPEIDAFDEINDRENRREAIQAIKDKRKATEKDNLRTFTVQADREEAVRYAEQWIQDYTVTNTTTRFKAEQAYADNLVDLVKSGDLKLPEVLPTVMYEYEGRSGKRTLTSSKATSDLLKRLYDADEIADTQREAEFRQKVASDVDLILDMPERSEEQNILLEAGLKADKDYAGVLPPEIKSALKGHIDDWTAERHIKSALASQDDQLFDYQLANVSDTIYDKYKDKIAGPGVLAGTLESANIAQELLALTDLGAGNVQGDENKSIPWLTLHSRLQAEFNRVYKQQYKATASASQAYENTMKYLYAGIEDDATVTKWSTPAWRVEPTPEEAKERAEYTQMIRSGYNQGINNQWKKKKISLTTVDEQELVDWSKGDKRARDIPTAYLDLSRLLHEIPADLVKAQLRFLTEEEVQIDENELLKNDKIIDLLIRRTKSSLTQAYAIHNQGDIETNAKTDVFNKKILVNPDIN